MEKINMIVSGNNLWKWHNNSENEFGIDGIDEEPKTFS